MERETFLSRWKGGRSLYSPQTGRGGETKEINREREIWGGYVCVDAERRDKFPRIAWNRQNRSLFYGYGEYSCLHVIVMMIYISIRESIFFPGFLATRNSSPLYFLYIYYSELCVCIIFTENPLKGGYMDARSLHFTPLSKNGLDESSAKV